MTKNAVDNINNTSNTTSDIQEYLERISERERKVIEIAKEVLESSFNIQKSIGFEEWKKISK